MSNNFKYFGFVIKEIFKFGPFHICQVINNADIFPNSMPEVQQIFAILTLCELIIKNRKFLLYLFCGE